MDKPGKKRPNVLLVCVDHWPGNLLSMAGHPTVETPTLDQIARNGIRFSRAYSECPVCIAARRSLMTGVSPRTHGDRCFSEKMPMPDRPTLAGCFRQAGYQCFAAGKLHVYPPRDRIGFQDVQLCEEGRLQFGVVDDYELYLGDSGFAGRQFEHGMGSNDYIYRPWHLPEAAHPVNWTTRQLARLIQRRDPRKPGFWYLSYTHPHPPLVPLEAYLDLYREVEPPPPYMGDWSENGNALPRALELREAKYPPYPAGQVARIRRAFYALCTHIDHQLRVVIGTLREEGLLENTIILFTSDHGDMLGDHQQWAKGLFYESSARVPMLLSGTVANEEVVPGTVDERLVCLADVVPTLLGLCGIPNPDGVEGLSMTGSTRREILYGEYEEDARATRMIHDGRYKLIYYPAGNRFQLFDLQNDPGEERDLFGKEAYHEILEKLKARLAESLYGKDSEWLEGGRFRGVEEGPAPASENRRFNMQRGSHWPPPLGPRP